MSKEINSEFDCGQLDDSVGIDVAGSSMSDRVFAGRVRFGEWMVGNGHITNDVLDKALIDQSSGGGQLGEVLQRLGVLSEGEVIRLLSEYLSIEFISLKDVSKIDMEVARGLGESISRRFNVLGIGVSDGRVVLAMVDPLD